MDHPRHGVVVRRQVAHLARIDVDAVQMEVLVAAAVAQVKQRAGLVRPEELADATQLVVGDDACFGRVLGRCHPHVHHPVHCGGPAQVLAVGADAHAAAIGIAEQRFAGNEFRFGGGSGQRHGVGDGQGQRGEQQGGAGHGRSPLVGAKGRGDHDADSARVQAVPMGPVTIDPVTMVPVTIGPGRGAHGWQLRRPVVRPSTAGCDSPAPRPDVRCR